MHASDGLEPLNDGTGRQLTPGARPLLEKAGSGRVIDKAQACEWRRRPRDDLPEQDDVGREEALDDEAVVLLPSVVEADRRLIRPEASTQGEIELGAGVGPRRQRGFGGVEREALRREWLEVEHRLDHVTLCTLATRPNAMNDVVVARVTVLDRVLAAGAEDVEQPPKVPVPRHFHKNGQDIDEEADYALQLREVAPFEGDADQEPLLTAGLAEQDGKRRQIHREFGRLPFHGETANGVDQGSRQRQPDLIAPDLRADRHRGTKGWNRELRR